MYNMQSSTVIGTTAQTFKFLQKARFYDTSPGYSNSKNPSQKSLMPFPMVNACTLIHAYLLKLDANISPVIVVKSLSQDQDNQT